MVLVILLLALFITLFAYAICRGGAQIEMSQEEEQFMQTW